MLRHPHGLKQLENYTDKTNILQGSIPMTVKELLYKLAHYHHDQITLFIKYMNGCNSHYFEKHIYSMHYDDYYVIEYEETPLADELTIWCQISEV